MKIRCLVLLLVLSFFVMTLVQFCIPQLPLAYAQSEEDEEQQKEEDEEPIQARPNPMQNYTRGVAGKTSMQKSALKMKAASTETSEVMEGEGAATEQGISTEIVSMPIDPYGTQAGADSTIGTSTVTEEGVGSASWDPSELPAGWDPFDKEANLDSAEMHQ